MADNAVELLREIYNDHGPRQGNAKVVDPVEYAKMTADEIDGTWDFEARWRMHRIAKVIAAADRRRARR